MSCDFGVWFPHKRLSSAEAGTLYVKLCEGQGTFIEPHPSIQAFYNELVELHPEISDVPEEREGDFDHSPWSCAIDRSEAHVIMCCVWPKADYVSRLVGDLARKHGLAVYDPQSERIAYPGEGAGGSKPWWKVW